MSAGSRIDDLRRRVLSDPSSIAFAALAEEYRRAGQFQEAVAVCRRGLSRHPSYLSARVTLGRALLELEELDEAELELQQVLATAPDNLAAMKALSDIRTRRQQAVPPDRSAARGMEPQPDPALATLDRLLHAIARLRSLPI